MARADAVPRLPAKREYSVRQRYWGIIFILLLLLGLLSLALFLFSPSLTSAQGDLPVGLRSPLKANYAMDPHRYALPPLKVDILGDALADRSASNLPGAPNSQLATLLAALNSPVPSITPLPGSTESPPPVPSPTTKVIPTWLIYTGTVAASPTAAPSATPTRDFTAVLTITPPPFFTATYQIVTVVPVTLTSTLTATQTPTKTQYAATQAATRTAEPTKNLPTSTPKATATPATTLIVTLPPSPVPSATSGYPPPPPQETVTTPAYP